jgi:hypothetical protein
MRREPGQFDGPAILPGQSSEKPAEVHLHAISVISKKTEYSQTVADKHPWKHL